MQYDGGIRVPMIVQWPVKTTPNTKNNEVIHVIDFYPTLVEMAEAKLPDSKLYPLDGESFVPILVGQSAQLKRKAIFGHFPGYLGNRSKPTSYCIKNIGNERFKMLYFYENQTYELYKINTDLGETQNLLLGKPSEKLMIIANTMRDEMLAWLIKMKPEQMTYRSSGELVPLPKPITSN